MRRHVLGLLLSITAIGWCAPASAQEPPRMVRDGSVAIGGRQVRCDNARARLDADLPNLGAADPRSRLLILNPMLMRRMTGTVQLFVFHHECGHHHVGGDELAADCWAVGRGLADGWLTTDGLKDVCGSFGKTAETETHPSARRRCAALDRCFATASAEIARSKPQTRVAAVPPEPKLVSGPRLLWSSVRR